MALLSHWSPLAIYIATTVNILGDILNVMLFHGGMAGIAVATTISCFFELLVLLLHYARKTSQLKPSPCLRFRMEWLKALSKGIPVMLHEMTVFLVGIAINFLISALITLLVVVNHKEMQKIYFWTMGSLTHTSWMEIAWLVPVMGICVGILFYYAKALNIMQVGTETARTLGIDTERTTRVVLVTSSVLISVVVAFCGSIGFIGLIMPHVARILFGSNNRRLFTYSLFFGAFFLLVADTLARTVAAPAELPVGSITALAGAPYFIWLVLRKK